MNCLKDTFLFISSERSVSSSDIAVFPGSSKSTYYRGLFQQFKCPVCDSIWGPLGIDLASFYYHLILPVLASCSKCKERFNVVFYDTPWTYYSEADRLGDTVLEVSPAAALVFYVAALENFLTKAFAFSSEENRLLVLQRKVSFQDLRTAKKIFREQYATNLPQLCGNAAWQAIMAAVQDRHSIVHNAGHDKNLNPINITHERARIVLKHIESLVSNLDPIMKRKCVY